MKIISFFHTLGHLPHPLAGALIRILSQNMGLIGVCNWGYVK